MLKREDLCQYVKISTLKKQAIPQPNNWMKIRIKLWIIGKIIFVGEHSVWIHPTANKIKWHKSSCLFFFRMRVMSFLDKWDNIHVSLNMHIHIAGNWNSNNRTSTHRFKCNKNYCTDGHAKPLCECRALFLCIFVQMSDFQVLFWSVKKPIEVQPGFGRNLCNISMFAPISINLNV